LPALRFPLALAVLLFGQVDAAGAERLGRRWRLSNKEIQRTCWLVAQQNALSGAAARPWSVVQPTMIDAGIDDLLAVYAAQAELGLADAADVAWAREVRARSPDQLNPPPLITGSDLGRLRIPAGPLYRALLERVRAAQLDGLVQSKEEALDLAQRWFGEEQLRQGRHN